MIQIIDRGVGIINVIRIVDNEVDDGHRHHAVGLRWTENSVFIYPEASAWRRRFLTTTPTVPVGTWIVENGRVEIRAEYSGTYPNWLRTRKGQKISPRENERLVLSDDDNRKLGLAGRMMIEQMLDAAKRARPGTLVRRLKAGEAT